MDDKQRIAFTRSIIAIADGLLADELDEVSAASRLENGAKWLRGVAEAKTPEDEPAVDSARLGPTMDEVRDVFNHWRNTTRRPRAKLSDARIAKIRAALKNFSAVQLKHITVWAVQNDHYSGANDRNKRYDTIETMYRSVARIEQLLEQAQWDDQKAESKAAAIVDIDKAREYRRVEEQSAKALREGRTNEYNELQCRLEQLDLEQA